VASSRPAQELLAPGHEPVVGRDFEEFTADAPTGALELLKAGRLRSYEATRAMRRGEGPAVASRWWVHVVGDEMPPRFALFIAESPATRLEYVLPSASCSEVRAVVGTADTHLVIDRISSEVEDLFGHPALDLLGQSILALVDETSVAGLLASIAHASATGEGVTLVVDTRSRAGATLRCESLLWPLIPAPSCAFVLVPVEEPPLPAGCRAKLERRLKGLAIGISALGVSRDLATGPREFQVSGLSRLTCRELDIVNRLVAGDRVPAIAAALFLSQSTVRNHLATVYQKLGVGRQQELVDLFRDHSDPPRCHEG
jgi:DNA-binding CsgD family transcriptional regulator